jgi:hypothetical protein
VLTLTAPDDPRRPSRSRRRRRRGSDAGVNQTAFVGLLVAVILVITNSLVVLGPKIGSQVADYLICVVFQQDDCRQNTAGQEPPGDPSDTSITIDNDDLGLDPGELQDLIDFAYPDGQFDSGQFTDLPGLNLPIPDENVIGGISVDDNGDLVLDLPPGYAAGPDGEVNENLDWKSIGIKIAAGVISVLAGLAATSACLAFFPEAGTFCGYWNGFFVTLVWNLVEPAMRGQTVDRQKFFEALGGAIIGGLPTLNGATAKVLNEAIPKIMRFIGNALKAAPGKVWAWMRPYVESGLGVAGDLFTGFANWVRNNPFTAAQSEPTIDAPCTNIGDLCT